MEKLRAPERFNLDAHDLADAWKKWKEELNLYIDLVMDIGTRGREIYLTMAFDQEPQNRTLEMVLQAFDGYCNPKRNENGRTQKQYTHKTKSSYAQTSSACKYCGRKHEFNKAKCPAFGKECRKCGKANHFESMCKSEQKSRQRRHPGHRVRAISEESDESNDYFEINTVTLTNVNSVKEKHSRHIYASMKIIGKNEKSKLTRFQLDSGATCNIITARTLKELDINQLQKTSQILTMYNNTTIKPIGKCILKLVNPKNNDKFKAEFVVVKDGTLTPLLGSKAVQAMNLVTVNYENIKAVRQGALTKPLSKEIVMKEYADIFEWTGKLEGKYHLELDNTANPVVHPPRKVPVAIKKRSFIPNWKD
ncbi:unnamed protein product [Mytilus coruscus]|uniref:Peptidase A2 domain-containing protein n=1 Tax=Mytilus coruscus TaxID=42192 RepID=A0A6J8DIV5_MYTCO|nr:unnamed protein product [Mytilus coruscus]